MQKKAPIFVGSLVGILALGATVYASAYEWFDGGTLHNLATGASLGRPGTGALGVRPGDTLRLKYRVHTSAPFAENRSLYIVSSTSTGNIYSEVTSCRKSGPVANVVDESCDLTYSYAGGNSHTIRVTTNYDGCGSFTPTPTAECGDALDFPVDSR